MDRDQTAFIILGMLSIEPKSGYDIRKSIQSSVTHFWRESYGQIYPALKRLAGQGLIIPGRASGSGRKSRKYALSSRGRARLLEWLAAPHRTQPPRNEFLLKLYFGRLAPTAVSAHRLRDFQREQEGFLAALLEIERQASELNAGYPDFPFWMLTLSYGISQTRAAIEWSKSAIATLPSDSKPASSNLKNRRQP